MGALERARAAYAEKRWADARDLFVRAGPETALEPGDLERLAVTLHCLGRNDESCETWARAYTSYLQAGDFEAAALAAAWCSFDLLTRGEMALGSGWMARAEALCEEHGRDGRAGGFLLGQTAAGIMLSGDPVTALPMFVAAQAMADRVGDPNAKALSRLGRGQCLIFAGNVEEGLAFLDEVMVTITTDEVSPLVTGLAFCAAIEGCHQTLDLRRAQEWTSALSRWCDGQPDLVPFRGQCLVHRAELLALHGAWQEAYGEAERARDWLAETLGPGGALYQIAELHRLRGEYAEAEAAYKEASQHGNETQPGLGLLRLAQGHVESAGAAIRRALDESPEGAARARLLAARVQIALAAADVTDARATATELCKLADAHDVPLLRALALHADGAVTLAESDARAALPLLRRAWNTWQDLAAPYEGARARVLIGQACRSLGDGDTAEMEFDAARWVFQELGAAPDLDVVAKLSRSASATAPGGLSLREVQVLRLVATGKTNRAIAGELFLSEKTVARHLSNIFTKLDVSSRAAATAYAFNHDLV